jgi:hypothetical protein
VIRFRINKREEFTPRKILLLLILYGLFGCALAYRRDHPVGQFFYLDGYVAEINTPTYGNDTTKKLLDEFNDMSSYKDAVSYKDDHLFIHREIHIIEAQTLPRVGPETDKDLTTVGLTENKGDRCLIQVLSTLSYEEYRTVLMHEYCHCFGYPDLYSDKDKNDLMFHINNKVDEDNIKWYSEDIAVKVHKWKNLQNLNLSTKPTK